MDNKEMFKNRIYALGIPTAKIEAYKRLYVWGGPYFYCFIMLSRNQKSRKGNTYVPLNILILPPINHIQTVASPRPEINLCRVEGKKGILQVHKMYIPKRYLFCQLYIYEWRNSTNFPIPKIKFVSIEQTKEVNSTSLLIYTEHCPLRLPELQEVAFPHLIYLFKECLYGFYRLCLKFGPFQIQYNMIALNYKGFCRVWIHYDFKKNSIHAPASEIHMIQSLKSILYKYSQKSRTSQKLFEKLRNCYSFFSCLKYIDTFVNVYKISISKRFPIGQSESSSRLSTFNPLDQITRTISNISKYKYRQSVMSKNNYSYQDVMNSYIKRFKSYDKLRTNVMKISDGYTAYTKNVKDTKCSITGFYSSPRDTHITQVNSKDRQWMVESSFTMDYEYSQLPRERKDKKELSHSEAMIKNNFSDKKIPIIRKLSSDNGFYRFGAAFGTQHEIFGTQNYIFGTNREISENNQIENRHIKTEHKDEVLENKISRTENECYSGDYFLPASSFTSEFNQLFMDEPSGVKPTSSKPIENEEEYEKAMSAIRERVMKDNGWNTISSFLCSEDELNKSFQYYMYDEVPIMKYCIKLEKLDKINRRPVAMSILHYYSEDIV